MVHHIKRSGRCPYCSAWVRLTRFGQPFHQHRRGKACREGSMSPEAKRAARNKEKM